MRTLIMVSVLLAATLAGAKTFWIKHGTTDWTKAESYLDEDQKSPVGEPPGEGDLVAIPSGQTTVYLDASDTASWTLVNKLSQIAPRGTSSKLVITVAEGEATLSVPVTIFDTLLPGMTSKYSSIATAEKYGTLVKRGDGGLKLASAGALISGSASACDYLTGVDIQAGTLLLPQAAAGKLSFYLGSLVVATNATFFTCRNADNNTSYAATYVRSFAGGGVITNDNPGALAANSKQYYFGATRAETNEVVVGFKDAALVTEFSVRDAVTFGTVDPAEPLTVKVRSAGEPKGPVCWDGATVRCPDGFPGVAPGQSAVLFRGDEIVGGGIICKGGGV